MPFARKVRPLCLTMGYGEEVYIILFTIVIEHGVTDLSRGPPRCDLFVPLSGGVRLGMRFL